MPNIPVNPGNHPQKSLVDCNDISPLQNSINIDQSPQSCGVNPVPTLKNVANTEDSWLEDAKNQKTGLGYHNTCDPMLKGQIVEDADNPDRRVVFRYSKGLRACTDAMQDMFRNIIVEDDNGKAHPVPIMFGTQERAVNAIIQSNFRKDPSMVIDSVKLPLMAIHPTSYAFDPERFTYHKNVNYLNHKREDGKPGFTRNEKYERDTVYGVTRGIPVNIGYSLHAWTMYMEDIEQITEQIMLRFSPFAYIDIRGVTWETIVSLDSIGDNINFEPGEDLRVIKFTYEMTAKTYIPQPLVRKKAVLKMNVDVFNSVEEEKINDVFLRLEEEVKEFE